MLMTTGVPSCRFALTSPRGPLVDAKVASPFAGGLGLESIFLVEDDPDVRAVGKTRLLTIGRADRVRNYAELCPELELTAGSHRQIDLVRKIRLLLDRGAVGL